MMEEPLDLTAKEAAALGQLKEQLKDAKSIVKLESDRWLYRFLQARDFDVKKSAKMVRKSVLWRVRSDAENVEKTWKIPQLVEKYLPGGFCGHDIEGHPLWIDPFGKGDYQGLLHVASSEEVLRTRHRFMEYIESTLLPQSTALMGKTVDKIVVIYDMEGIGREHVQRPGLTTFQENVALALDNYPEYLHKTFVVNAPKLFTVLYNFLRPLMDQKTQKKVIIMGNNYKTELLNYFAAEQLPVCYGGTKETDGDPTCKDIINYGGMVPQDLYYQFPKDATFVQVASGHHHFIETEVTPADTGSILNWEFWTEEHDIIFEVVYRGAGPAPKPPPVSSPWCKKESILCDTRATDMENSTSEADLSIDLLHKQQQEEDRGGAAFATSRANGAGPPATKFDTASASSQLLHRVRERRIAVFSSRDLHHLLR